MDWSHLQIRSFANVHNYNVECHLQANENVEVGLLVIWLYLWLAFSVLLGSTLMRVVRLLLLALMPISYRVKRLSVLVLHDPTTFGEDEAIAREFRNFAREFLRPDGALILEMLEENVSMSAASGVARAAWEQHKNKRCDVTATPRDEPTMVVTATDEMQGPTTIHGPPIYPELGYGSGSGDGVPLMTQK